MIRTKIIVFRLEPFLQVGLRVKNDKLKKWKSHHFQRDLLRHASKMGSRWTKYVSVSNTTLLTISEPSHVIWVNPLHWDIEKIYKISEHIDILKHFRRLRQKYSYYDIWKAVGESGESALYHRAPDRTIKRVQYVRARVRHGYVTRIDPRRICVKPTSGGVAVPFILDTGSEITCCHDSWVTHPWDIPKGVITTKEPYTILTANGTVLNQTHNPILARLTFGHKKCLVKVFFFDNLECNLLGMDFVMNNEVSILVSHNAGFNLQFAGDRRTIPTSVNCRIPAYPTQEVTIPPGESEIKCKVNDLHCAHVRINPISNLSVPQIKPKLYNVNCSKVTITVNNPLPIAIDLRTEDEVGLAEILQGSYIKTKHHQAFFVQEQQPPNMNDVITFKNELLKEQQLESIQNPPQVWESDSDEDDYFMPMKKIEKEEILKDTNIKPAGLFEEEKAQEAVEHIINELMEDEKNLHEDFLQKGQPELKGYDFRVNEDKSTSVIELPENEYLLFLQKTVTELFPPQYVDMMINFFLEDAVTLIPKHSLDIGKMKGAVIKDFGFPDDCKVKTKPFRLSKEERDIAEAMLQDMVYYKILVKGSSAYYSAVFVIPKSTPGQWRLVTDYREANKVSKSAFYGIPTINQILDKIAYVKPKMFSKIDIKMAYASIPLEGKAQEQAALISPNGVVYKCKRLLFGNKVSPAIFNERMGKILERKPGFDWQHDYFSQYFDDIIIYSSEPSAEFLKDFPDATPETFHLYIVKTILMKLNDWGLRISLEKCAFMQPEIDFLGRRLNKYGVLISPRHIKRLQQLQWPETRKQVDSIIGMLGWHQFMLLLYPMYIQPIRDVVKLEKFEWTKEAQDALTYFKQVITEDLITFWPDFTQPIYVCTDASEYSFGAMAYQILEIDTSQENWKETIPTSLKAPLKPIFPVSGSGVPSPFCSQDPQLVLQEFEKMNLNMKVDPERSNTDKYYYLKPVAYYGRAFSAQQRRWTALEKEASALSSTLVGLHEMLKNFTTVYCIVDSQSLLYLLKGEQMKNNKITRWVLQIKEYTNASYFFLHCKGKLHTLADTLSRNVFIPMIKEETHGRVNLKKPLMVSSPFRSGEMVNLQQVERLLREFPNLVYQFASEQPPPLSIKQIEKLQAKTPLRYSNLIYSSNVRLLLKYFTDAEIQKEQGKDELCGKVRRLLHQQATNDQEDCKVDCVKRHDHTYYYKFCDLYYRRKALGDPPDGTGRLIVPESRIMVLFALYHTDNHCGALSLASSLSGPYYFPKLHQRLRQLTSRCHYCAIFKPTKTTTQLATRPYRPILEPNFMWHIDEVVGLESADRMTSFLTCIEEFTGFKIAIGLRSRKADYIAKRLEERLLSTFSPRVVASDRGTNLLLSKALGKKLKKYGVDAHVGVAYSPKSHGKVENANKSIEILLSIITDQTGEPWANNLDYTVALLNHRPQPHMNNLSSYFMMFGTHPPVPTKPHALQATFPDPQNMEEVWKLHHQMLRELRRKDDKIKNKMYKKRGGKKHSSFQVNDLVYMMDVRIRQKPKLLARFFRLPLKIIQVRPPVVITQDLNLSGIIRCIHFDRIRKCLQYEVDAFQQLPPQIQVQLGTSFTSFDIQELLRKENLTQMPKLYRLRPNEKLPIETKHVIDPRIDLPPEDPEIQKEKVTLDAPYDFEDTDWVNVFGEPSPERAKIEDDNLQHDVSRQMEALNNETSNITQNEEPKQVAFEKDV